MAGGSTQEFLEIEAIKEGLVILKDRSVRGVLMVSSLNFALKSDEEQQAIIFQFQNFLNSLDFSAQILIQSRRLNLTGYLEKLDNLANSQTNALLQKQTVDYKNFIEELVKGGSIMAKNFFVTVPFTLIETLPLSDQGNVFQRIKVAGNLSDEQIQRMKIQLWQRLEFVALGLKRAGLQVAPLNTQELIELFWSWHHPSEAEVGYYPEIPPEVLQ
ncbi:MAG: hypothetical protein HYV78_01685 [Candidatus Wildermuthbacteria bacterium]|nr:hypothetical protein [Candidatus Wildermuthbacteria bacterium]